MTAGVLTEANRMTGEEAQYVGRMGEEEEEAEKKG